VLEESEEEQGEPEKEPAAKEQKASLSSYSVKELEGLLEEVLNEENYERAAEIRDEIDRRKKDS